MITPHLFTFPGLWPYIEIAAAGRDLPYLGRSRGLWHYRQVQDSLGQLPGLSDDARRELLDHVASVRDSLAASLEGIDLAVRASLLALEIQLDGLSAGPGPAETTESTPRRAAGARRRRE